MLYFRPDVSKARISFSASADFSKKEDDELTVSIKIEESGKILSSGINYCSFLCCIN